VADRAGETAGKKAFVSRCASLQFLLFRQTSDFTATTGSWTRERRGGFTYMQLELELRLPLPTYTVQHSRRARYLSVRVTPQLGVTVTLPSGLREDAIEPFLLEHREWLERELLAAERHPTAHQRGRLPASIELPALQRNISVRYEGQPGTRVRVTESVAGLRVAGSVADKHAVCAALCRWLSRLAKRELVARLRRLSAASGLGYSRCSIRGQRGRWGSASTSGHVCLNYKLLFLSPAVVDYVLLHELTHTLHPDHSPRFWRRLEAVLPDCRRRHEELQRAAVAVPWWAEQ